MRTRLHRNVVIFNVVLCLQLCSAIDTRAQTQHTDTVINYLNWNGTAMWAKLEGNYFRVSQDGSGIPWEQVPLSNTIRYKTWGGGNWEASLSNKVFTHAPNGDWNQAHTDTIINYIAGDGKNWTAVVLNENTFQHTPSGYVPPQSRRPDWQIHADWCTRDGGSSGRRYLAVCKDHDQYEAVLACQQDAEQGHPDDRTSLTIISAGPAAVNAYMADKIPTGCTKQVGGPPSPPPAQPYYLIWRWACRYDDGSAGGDCTVTTRDAKSCQGALYEMNRLTQAGDICRTRCDQQKHVDGPAQHITGAGPCVGI